MDRIEQLHAHVQLAANGFDGFVCMYDKGLRAISRGDRVPYDWRSPSQLVRQFLNGDFRHLCQSLELLKTIECDEYAGQFARELSDAMLRLGEVTAFEWKRFGVTLRRDFTWSAQILLAVFRPRSFRGKRIPHAFVGRVSPDDFRRRVVDRILIVLRGLLTRLRDYAQLIDQKVERFPVPVSSGLRSDTFASGERGLLMVRLADGRYDYFDSGQSIRWDDSSAWFDRQETVVDAAVERLKRFFRLVGRSRSISEYLV